MNLKDKNKIQTELEELSWEFMVEVSASEIETEETEIQAELDKKPRAVSAGSWGEDKWAEVKYGGDEEIKSLYGPGPGELGLNGISRNAGIIFDEDKLENYRVVDWSRAPRVRKSKVNFFFRGVWLFLTWPFRMVRQAAVLIALTVYRSVAWAARGLVRLIKTIFITSWQIIVAFKYAFEYIFGDLSYLTRRKDPPAAARRIEPAPVRLVAYLSFGRRIRAVAGFVALALLFVVPWQAYLLYRNSGQVKGAVLGASEAGLRNLVAAGQAGQAFDLFTARERFYLAESDFARAEQDFLALGGLTSKAALIVPEVRNGKQLLELAKLSSQIGGHLTNAALVWGNLSQQLGSQASGGRVDWRSAQNELDQALSQSYAVYALLLETDVHSAAFAEYSGEFEKIKARMPQLISLLEDATRLSKVMVYLAGIDQPRRLMLVFQNNRELRPTGGFMGSYALVDMKDGKIKNLEVPGGGFYDLKGSLAVKVEAPYPFRVFSALWQPWNANWFPDWPTSAEKIEWFYENAGGSSLDAVIAVTPDVLEDLLKIVGEIDLPEYKAKVNSENFVRVALTEVESDYDRDENKPKKFIGDLFSLMIERLAKLETRDLPDLWQTLSAGLKSKNILIYLNDGNLQSQAGRFGWSGQMLTAPKDYLMLVHTNISGGKTDQVIETRLDHTAELLADGSIIDTVVLTKKHNGQAGDIFEGHTNYDYLRFYVPAGSKLLAASGFGSVPDGMEMQVVPEDTLKDEDLRQEEQSLVIDAETGMRITSEYDKTVFANWMNVSPGEEKQVKLKYLLPFRLSADIAEPVQEGHWWDLLKQYFSSAKNIPNKAGGIFDSQAPAAYSLVVQKQPGAGAHNFVSHFYCSDEWKLGDFVVSSGAPAVSEHGMTLNLALNQDEYYGLAVERQSSP